MTTTSSSVSSALAEAARTVLATAGPSVVRIGRGGGRGCGIVVADGFVLTNAHNLRDRTTEVTFADGRAVQASVVAADVDGDLVLVEVDTAGAPVLAWADGRPEVGALAYAIARTEGGGTRLTVGVLSSVDGAFRGPRGRRVSGTLEHTAPLARGSSGSPIVDDEGRLLGLNTARLGQGFYAALPADADLRTRVDALLRGESPAAAHARHRAGARGGRRQAPRLGRPTASHRPARAFGRPDRPRREPPACRSETSWPAPPARWCRPSTTSTRRCDRDRRRSSSSSSAAPRTSP